jgi:hypothetical protein
LAVAVTVAVATAFTELACAEKLTLDDPEGTVTLPGTTRLALLLEMLTAIPAAGAAPASDTVHETLATPLTATGLHDKADTPKIGDNAMDAA